MDFLKTFYQGILSKLKSEVDIINDLIPHAVTKGTVNEDSLKEIIRSFIPEKYSVGSGIIIDSHGNRSRQIDIIIYNNHSYPNLFRSSSCVLFPVEVVVAAIEVKTTLNADALDKTVENVKCLKQLKHYTDVVTRVRVSSKQERAIETSVLDTRPPLSILFAYNSDTKNPETWKKRFLQHHDKSNLPEFTVILELATSLLYLKENLECLYFPLRECDVDENGSKDKVLGAPKPNMRQSAGGMGYTSIGRPGENGYIVAMPDRALLNFLICLTEAIEEMPQHQSFNIRKYTSEFYDEGSIV